MSNNDVGPFQDIIEVGWPDGEPSDTGWIVNMFGGTAAGPPEFLGTEFGWAIELILPIKLMGEDPVMGITAERTVNWNVRRRLSITATIVNGAAYDSGGFPSAIETDVETIQTDQSFYQKTAFGVTGEQNVANIIVPKGPFIMNVGLAYGASGSPRRDPESSMLVNFMWSDF